MKHPAIILLALSFLFSACDNGEEKSGSVLFCTNAGLLNTPYEIELMVDGELAGTLCTLASSMHSEVGKEGSGGVLLLSLAPGDHSYSAKLNAKETGVVIQNWSGSFVQERGDNTRIFLNVYP